MPKRVFMSLTAVAVMFFFISASYSETLDSFESSSGWEKGLSNGASLSLSVAEGKNGNALKLDYRITPEAPWVQISKHFNVTDIKNAVFSFWIKGEGDACPIEFKLSDVDGSNFGKKINSITAEQEWKKVTIPFSSLGYFWGGDNKFDELQSVWFAVSTPTGGKGYFLLDDFSVTTPGDNEPPAAPSKPAPAASPSAPAASSPGILDAFESTAGWNKGAADGAKIEIKTSGGVTGNAMEVDFSLTAKAQWAQIDKDFSVDNIQNATFSFWMKGEGEPCALEFKLLDDDKSNFGKKWEGLTAEPNWTNIKVPFSSLKYFWGGDKKFDNLKKVYIAVSSAAGGKGKFYLDELSVSTSGKVTSAPAPYPAQKTVKGAGLLADFESTSPWEKGGADGASITLKSVPGRTGNALALNFKITSEAPWVQIKKNIEIDDPSSITFTFWYKMPGSSTRLEFKCVDEDGSNFGKSFDNLSATDEWKKITIPFSSLKYFWGGDNKFGGIKMIYIAISSAQGGEGSIIFDDLEYIKKKQ